MNTCTNMCVSLAYRRVFTVTAYGSLVCRVRLLIETLNDQPQQTDYPWWAIYMAAKVM